MSDDTQIPEAEFDDARCGECGAPREEGKAYPLCRACRDKFIRYPVPIPIGLLVVAMIAVGTAGYFLRKEQLRAAIDFERGETAERKGNYPEATTRYESALHTFPENPRLLIRLAATYEKSGHPTEALQTLAPLAGKKMKKEWVKEANGIIDRAEKGR